MFKYLSEQLIIWTCSEIEIYLPHYEGFCHEYE